MLAGIGNAYGQKLQNNGFLKAKQVLGVFLMLDTNQDKFKAWLKATCGASPKNQNQCCECLTVWLKQYPLKL